MLAQETPCTSPQSRMQHRQQGTITPSAALTIPYAGTQVQTQVAAPWTAHPISRFQGIFCTLPFRAQFFFGGVARRSRSPGIREGTQDPVCAALPTKIREALVGRFKSGLCCIILPCQWSFFESRVVPKLEPAGLSLSGSWIYCKQPPLQQPVYIRKPP